MGFFKFLIIVFVVALIVKIVIEFNRPPRSATEIQREHAQTQYGSTNYKMVCPHCNESGYIRTKPITQKKGVSGGKATAAILTVGVSMLATGLSRKEKNTQAHCTNCNNTWVF